MEKRYIFLQVHGIDHIDKFKELLGFLKPYHSENDYNSVYDLGYIPTSKRLGDTQLSWDTTEEKYYTKTLFWVLFQLGFVDELRNITPEPIIEPNDEPTEEAMKESMRKEIEKARQNPNPLENCEFSKSSNPNTQVVPSFCEYAWYADYQKKRARNKNTQTFST